MFLSYRKRCWSYSDFDINMPSNQDFSLHVLVGDTILPEYEKDGLVYVESNFFTPVSFKQQAEENVDGEVEIQVQTGF